MTDTNRRDDGMNPSINHGLAAINIDRQDADDLLRSGMDPEKVRGLIARRVSAWSRRDAAERRLAEARAEWNEASSLAAKACGDVRRALLKIKEKV